MSKLEQIDQLTQHLFAQRKVRDPASDFELFKPKSIDDAFAVQQQMIELSGNAVTGWKCLVPLDNGQLIFAPIIATAVNQQTCCPIIANLKGVEAVGLIEPEIAFVLGQDFDANQEYSIEKIDSGISATHMALELIQGRFSADYSASYFENLADGLSNQGLYIGPEIDKALAYQASKVNITVSHQDEVRSFTGIHPCNLPQNPVYWLVNYLTSKGVSLKKGQAIITGSYCGVIKVPMYTLVKFQYQGLGEMQLKFIMQHELA
jgi:2-keto-4-pentenoate hydratase